MRLWYVHTLEGAWRSVAQVPECAGQANGAKKRFRFFKRVSSPIRLHLVSVPAVSEAPRLFGRDDSAAGKIARAAPSIEVLFIPQAQHASAREADAVPPMVRRT